MRQHLYQSRDGELNALNATVLYSKSNIKFEFVLPNLSTAPGEFGAVERVGPQQLFAANVASSFSSSVLAMPRDARRARVCFILPCALPLARDCATVARLQELVFQSDLSLSSNFVDMQTMCGARSAFFHALGRPVSACGVSLFFSLAIYFSSLSFGITCVCY